MIFANATYNVGIKPIIRISVVLAFCFGLFVGCTKSIRTQADYMKWLNNPSNGLVKIKHVGGFDLKVKFLPPSYLLYQDIAKNGNIISSKERDSLSTIYNHSLTFLFTIGPDVADSNKTS